VSEILAKVVGVK